LQNSPPEFFDKKKSRYIFALCSNTSASSSDLNGHIQLWQIADNPQMDKTKEGGSLSYRPLSCFFSE
jgi:hypothetical protein